MSCLIKCPMKMSNIKLKLKQTEIEVSRISRLAVQKYHLVGEEMVSNVVGREVAICRYLYKISDIY